MAEDFQFLWYWDGSAASKWVRMGVRRLVDTVAKIEKPTNLYQSPQLYRNPVDTPKEAVFLHPYVDLDCKEDPAEALREARELARYMEEEVGLKPDDQRWNYSGQKGFHAVFSGFALGVEPHVEATSICKAMVETVARVLELQTVDVGVYSSRRVLRIPNTIHGSTGRCALALSLESLRSRSFEEIVSAAEKRNKPYPAWRFPDVRSGYCDPSFWPLFVEMHEARKDLIQHKSRSSVRKSQGGGDHPPCVLDVLRNGLKKPGSRNEMTFKLAHYFKQCEFPKDVTTEILTDWTHRVHANETGEEQAPRRVLQNMRSAIDSVWASDHGFFSCAAFLNGGTPGNPITCNPNCGFIVQEDQDGLGRLRLSLEESVKACHVGRPVTIDGMVLAKEPQPQVVPYEAVVRCSPQDGCASCKKCALRDTKGGRKSLDGHEDALLRVAETASEAAIKKTFERLAGVPKDCPGRYTEIVREENLLRVLIQSTAQSYGTNGKVIWRENQIALLSHTIDDQKIYSFDAKLYPLPGKAKTAIHVATEARSVQSGIDAFRMTDEIHEQLKIFQARPGSATSKLLDIGADWESNVHNIYGRTWNALGLALTWFSPLQIIRDGKVMRGWLEVLSYGDTAQGKSEVANRLLEFFGHGQLISGESTSLAGLLMGVEKLNNKNVPRIGALCRNDRGLLHIDEWGAMGIDCKSGLTSPRSSGVALLSKIASAQALCRTRKIASSNCIDQFGKPTRMWTRPYGCMHAVLIASSPEDLRRFDYAMAFADSERIADAMYSTHEKVPHIYVAELAHNLILWAWTRQPQQVEFTPEAMALIMRLSRTLSKTYSRNIPLLDAGDTPNKLMRLAASIAALLFSTPDGEKLVVTKEHVDVADFLLQQLYMDQDMQFYQYSKHDMMSRMASREEMIQASLDVAHMPKSKAAIQFMLQNESITTFDLENVVSLDREEAAAFLAACRQHAMITKSYGGFTLTSRGIQICKEITDYWRDHGMPLHGAVAEPPAPD